MRIDNKNVKKDGDEKFTLLDKLKSYAEYKNIFPHVDLKFEISTGKLKENLILKNKNASAEYIVKYNIGNLRAEQKDERTVVLKNGGISEYVISAPVMFDNAGEISEELTLSIVECENGILRVRLSVDKNWLKEKDRSFPVTVDPVTYDVSYDEIDATFVSSKNKTTCYETNETVCVSNGDAVYETAYAIIKFAIDDAKYQAYRMVSAEYNLPVISCSSQEMMLSVYGITGTLPEDGITYDTQLNVSSTIVDYAKISTGSTASFDIAAMLNRADGNAYNGIAIKAGSAGTAVLAKSSETPIFEVKYIGTRGVDESFSYSQFDLGDAGQVYINNLTGNLVFTREELSTLGETEPYQISSTYNSISADSENQTDLSGDWLQGSSGIFVYFPHLFVDETGNLVGLKGTYDSDTRTLSNIAENPAGWTKVQTTKTLIGIGTEFDAWKDDESIKYSFNTGGLVQKVQTDESGNQTYLFRKIKNEDDSTDYVDADGCRIKVTDTGTVKTIMQSSQGESSSNKGEVTRIGALGKSTANPVKNHNIESMSNWTKRYIDDSACSYSAVCSADEAYVGSQSLKVTVNSLSKAGGAGAYQIFDMSSGKVQGGKSYTASAYIKTSGITKSSVAASSRGYGAALLVRVFTPDGNTRIYTENLQKTDPNVNNGWERTFVNFTVPSDATKVTLWLLVRNGTGTAYFDAVQLEEGSTPGQYNMLENNAFQYVDSNSMPESWLRYHLTDDDKVENGNMKIVGNPNQDKGVLQEVTLKDAKQSDKYVFTAWANAASAPIKSGRRYGFHAMLFYEKSDGTVVNSWKAIENFSTCYNGKQYFLSSFDLSNADETLTPVKIRFVAAYYKNVNQAQFESLGLYKTSDVYDLGENTEDDSSTTDDSYTYDENGRILTYTDEDGNVYTYSYDSLGNLVSSLKSGGIGDRYTYYYYDSDGNGTNDSSVVHTEQYEDGSSYTYSYTSAWKMSQCVSVVDGKTTTEIYDENERLSSSSCDGVTTTYTYTSDGDTLSIVKSNGDGEWYTYHSNGSTATYRVKTGAKELTYTYTADGNLTSVAHNGFNYNYTYNTWSRPLSVKVGSQPLITYSYNGNGLVSCETYGNGSKVNYSYNAFGEVTSKSLEGVGSYSNIYDSKGRLLYVQDNVNAQKTYIKYDDDGRKVGEKVYSTASNALDNRVYKFEQNYDSENRLTKQSMTSTLTSVPVTYTYTENETAGTSSIAAKYANARVITTNYDADGRPVSRSFASDTPTTDEITYTEDGMVSTYRVGSDTFTYTYNADGRITHIRQNNVLRGHYGYYADGQLRRENNLDTNKTVIYTYDNGGNLTKKTEYPYTTSGTLGTATATISYTYDSTWKDKLTSYNGQSISYDAMGNPTSYRGATLTWFGRQLKSYTKGNTSVSYEYDENGLRTQKTVNGVVHDYYYVGDRLVYEKSGDSYELFYCYDADGRLAMVQRVIISSGTTNRFFAITNAQGDVIGLRSTTGAVIARYNYDAFGKLISVTDGNGNALTGNNFATQNGVRYRGYYYDSETGLYYLQSRYYDPETGRFLNADDVNFLGATETPISYNAFAYCRNNPVNYSDPEGHFVIYYDNLSKIQRANEHLLYNYLTIFKCFTNNTKGFGYIYGQSVGCISILKYGCKTLSYNGCEIIAMYNALKKLKKPKPIYEIIYDSETKGGLWLDGLFGTFPQFIGTYFKSLGIKTKSYYTAKSLDKNKKKGDIFIVVYNHTVAMLHAVMVEVISKNKISVYNDYNTATKAINYKSFSDMISNSGNFIVVAYKVG